MSVSLSGVSNQELVNRLTQFAAKEKELTHRIVLHLAEIDRRRLYADLGYTALFDYCTRGLGYSAETRYGNTAGFFYTPAFYDFLVLLTDTVLSKGRLTGAELMKALRFDGFRNGVSGKYSVHVSAKGVRSYSFPIFVYKIMPDSLTVIDKISLD